MRRYDDPVEVRRAAPDDPRSEAADPTDAGERPDQFLWRGRLWKVRAVLAHWVETGSWWRGDVASGAADDRARSGPGEGDLRVLPAPELLGERELWRVRAGRGGLETDGVFDLSFDWTDGSWQLVGCHD